MSQFEGYNDLKELDWIKYRETYGNIERLDLILEAEGDDVNRYKLAKQADVLMLPYLLGHDGLIKLMRDLGYTLSRDQLNSTVDYYLLRTAHGSTLSRVAHASVLAETDPDLACLRLSGETLVFAPSMPTGLGSVAFSINYRRHLLSIRLTPGRISISSAPGDAAPIKVQVGIQTKALATGRRRSFSVAPRMSIPASDGPLCPVVPVNS
ncbi:glycosyl hydrolase family 65 protein [Arthrobacter sp. H20]|uniref:glycosyl hydrolase family 65 protein n=1 Tax=Arthrobacter sp. H20 TaxID=1267981 RepID=UPI0020A6BBE4|nr:glycosyl hydrolase family 65 protein [Arthrobacter sp. H20]